MVVAGASVVAGTSGDLTSMLSVGVCSFLYWVDFLIFSCTHSGNLPNLVKSILVVAEPLQNISQT